MATATPACPVYKNYEREKKESEKIIMKQINLEINRKNVYWPEISIKLNGEIIVEMIGQCPHYYDVTSDWIFIFDTISGSGGYDKGPIKRKIYIGDCEFKKEEK